MCGKSMLYNKTVKKNSKKQTEKGKLAFEFDFHDAWEISNYDTMQSIFQILWEVYIYADNGELYSEFLRAFLAGLSDLDIEQFAQRMKERYKGIE